MVKRCFSISLCCLLFLSLTSMPTSASFLDRSYRISGQTMGTFYNITIVARKGFDARRCQKRIDAQLQMINQSMSCFDKTSEISRFNRAAPRVGVKISGDFLAVMEKADRLYTLTNGAWDGTVKPLVDLWGFGTAGELKIVPDRETIQKTLASTGFHHIDISGRTLKKRTTPLSLDLGSIAKGYGVDKVASLLKQSGITRFLVEIGGEIYAAGKNGKGAAWKVGISSPEKNGPAGELYKTVSLQDKAIATSGDYRNFITLGDKTWSHIIDPVTGFPVENRVVGASVITGDCTFADGLATALMVMETDRGAALVNSLDNCEAMIIVRDTKGQFQSILSDGFADYLE
ncbi:MAG TPA: FAD:protein FMN transferase [Desulfobacteraceae bacterium]|nr:FAD:protein FMN transferase [Desulfobacteraceae bacterium]